MNQNYSNAGIPKRHKSFRPTDNKDEKWNEIYNQLKDKVENGGIITILGDRGTGKTQMSACLIGFTTNNLSKSALYTKAFDVFLGIRNGMKNTSELEAVEKYLKPFTLVIDAFEVKADTEFESRVLDHIIDKRYDDMKTTIIIANDKLESFTAKIGQSTLDRISETGAIKILKGISKR